LPTKALTKRLTARFLRRRFFENAPCFVAKKSVQVIKGRDFARLSAAHKTVTPKSPFLSLTALVPSAGKSLAKFGGVHQHPLERDRPYLLMKLHLARLRFS
jgi:hypothetical protein